MGTVGGNPAELVRRIATGERGAFFLLLSFMSGFSGEEKGNNPAKKRQRSVRHH
jgi:hypothetical protein